MFKVISNISSPITCASKQEARRIMGRDYNIYLADRYRKNNSYNPIRDINDHCAFIQDSNGMAQWKIVEERAS